jgi:hypothetical protein
MTDMLLAKVASAAIAMAAANYSDRNECGFERTKHYTAAVAPLLNPTLQEKTRYAIIIRGSMYVSGYARAYAYSQGLSPCVMLQREFTGGKTPILKNKSSDRIRWLLEQIPGIQLDR